MGWSGGSHLFSEVITTLQKHVQDEDDREAIYVELIDAFEEADWDTLDECMGEDPAYDAAVKFLHPDWYDEEEDEE